MVWCARMQVFVNGIAVGSLERNGRQFMSLGALADDASKLNPDSTYANLDILVYNMGRVNTKRDWDLKGLISPLVLLNSKPSSPLCRHFRDCSCMCPPLLQVPAACAFCAEWQPPMLSWLLRVTLSNGL